MGPTAAPSLRAARRAWLVASEGEQVLAAHEREAVLRDLRGDLVEARIPLQGETDRDRAQREARASRLDALIHGLAVELPAAIARAERAEGIVESVRGVRS